MRECPTYMVMLPYSEAALNDIKMGEIEEAIQSFLREDAFISIWPTPFNHVCRYTVAVTVLRDSLEAAKPICNAIVDSLSAIDEKTICYQTTLLYGDDAPKVFVELPGFLT